MKRKRYPTGPREGRRHGDSYSEPTAREPDLAGTTSTHEKAIERQPEEPSDPPLDAPERLEGDL